MALTATAIASATARPLEEAPAAARVLEAWDETPSLRAVRAAVSPAWASAHERSGQVVKLRSAGHELYLALASAPSRDGAVDLLVKRGGHLADAAIAGASRGAPLEMTAPFGKGFPLEEARGRNVLLFAAGSGIAPIRALVQHLLRHRADFRRVTLFYGQRRGADFAYLREHVAWERGGVRVVLCPSAEDDAWPGVRGRVHEVARSTCFGGAPLEDAVTFVCGMRGMVDAVKATLAEAGMSPGCVHLNC
jgi:NAD(P)H-flavin reductase